METINALLVGDLSFEHLLRNREAYDKYFREGYLPVTELKDNLLVKKYDEVIYDNVSSENYIARTIFFDQYGNLIDDGPIDPDDESSYYTEIPNSGYVARLILYTPFSSGHFDVEYFSDINRIKLEKNFDSVKEGVSMELTIAQFDFESIDQKVAESIINFLDNQNAVFTTCFTKCL